MTDNSRPTVLNILSLFHCLHLFVGRQFSVQTHYENLLMQYTESFFQRKQNGTFNRKCLIRVFLIFLLKTLIVDILEQK